MSTSTLYHGFGLKGYDYVRSDYREGAIIFTARPQARLIVCPVCGCSEIIRRGSFTRMLRTVPIGCKPVWLEIEAPRVECRRCEIVRQIDLRIAEPKRWYSNAFKRMVMDLGGFMSMLDIARWLKVGWDTIKGIIKEQLQKRYSKPSLRNLKHLAIDEISVRKGHKYLTLVMNLETGAVIFVGEGKGADALDPFWKQLGQRRRKVKAVSMDMSAAYIKAVSDNLPKAKIVFDHFHVVKLMNDKLSALRRSLYHEINDILGKEALKGTRWILLKAPENLDDKRKERERLAEVLSLNEPLATAYYMKEDLRQIWGQKNKQVATKVLQNWINTALNSGIKALVDMGKTLAKYRYGILNWYDHKISSGPMEGTNNKIKTLKRQAYGFRDLEFFKLRILAIHEATYAFTG